MNILEIIREVRRHLEENGRLSLRMLRRQFELDDDALEEVIEELVDVQGIARRDGMVLEWAGAGASTKAPERTAQDPAARTQQSSPALAGERKIVTIVFADLAGSTALQERLDAESARVFMQRYYEAMRAAVVAHGGTVAKLLGDGVLAVFGTPRVAEDDAPRAVHAAFSMHAAFRELAQEHTALVGAIGLRVAVNTGEVIASGDSEIVGDPVNVAARLQEQCGDGEVVVGEATHRLVSQLVTLSPLGSLALKGRAGAVKAYRVESLERPSGVIQAQFVGRDEEIARMTAVFDQAVSKPATELSVLLGSPGLGKSRLIDEFSERLADTANVVSAHCNEAGGATFAPLVLALREFLEIDAAADSDAARAAIEAAIPEHYDDRARIAKGIAALFAGSTTSPEETFFVVRRFFAALAAKRPVILVVDDLQWAEPMLLDLIEHLVEWGGNVPMLVLVGARPELRAKRSSLATPGGLVSDVVTLSGLDATAAMRLAANVIGASDLPAAVAAKVLATSEGNPLFVGELVRMLVHEGALKKEGDRWTTGTALAALEMPPTIHALLAARIERLQPAERIVLERAAVVGRHFSRSAVAELLPGNNADLDTRLESLQRSELIERDTGWFLGEPVLRFHHVLIRDAAYRQLLKGSRAELHSRFADWVRTRAGDSVDHDETIGWHLEQAHILLGELGPIDTEGRAIGERASKNLAAAGRRALAGDDISLAASLIGRAIKRLDLEDASRSELALDWCEALLAAGDVAIATEALDELERFVGDSKRLRAWHTCFTGQHKVLTSPEDLEGTAAAVAAAAESMTQEKDPAGEAKAHFVHALALASLGRVGACEAALDRALAAARRVAGDRRRANTVLAVAPLAALWGPSPVTRASGRCLDVVRVLRITQGAPAVEAVALSCQGVLEALRGRTDAARRMIASSRKMVEELGITQRLLEVDVSSGLIDLLEGDAAAAESSLRRAYYGLRDLGLGIDAARAAALLARALLAQDQAAEAEQLSHESEALAGDDLKAAIAWRGVRAEALARRGEHTEAVEFANKAVEIAAATDALLDHADARLALAAALRAAGRGRDADAEERRAHELWEAKGASLLAERARSEGARSGAAPASPVTVSAPQPQSSASAPERTVRTNAATSTTERLEAAVAAREDAEVRSMFAEGYQEIDHPTGGVFGRDASLRSLRGLLRSEDPFFDLGSLASLGTSLALARRRSGARGTDSGRYDVGAYETEALHVMGVDGDGCFAWMEIFADNRLDDAIACLYRRYAELQPEGPTRERALATQRSMAAVLETSNDLDRMASVIAPDFESVDHRPLRTWTMRGVDAYLEHMGALLAVADDVAIRSVDVLALEPNALLIRRLHSGTEHVGGGVYERAFLSLFVTDDNGQFARAEWFAEEQATQALARFDELISTTPALSRETARRVVEIDATRFYRRYDDAIAARDLAAIEALLADHMTVVHHSAGPSYDKTAFLQQWAFAFEAEHTERRAELLGALGDCLVLGRTWTDISGMKQAGFEDFGPTEIHDVFVVETDGAERGVRADLFAPERLGNAVIRLYERYAELCPDGPDRDRARRTAQAFAAAFGLPDLDAMIEIYTPDIELIDHRTLGFPCQRGIEAMREWLRAFFEVEDFVINIDDVVRLQSDAALLALTTAGTARNSGGAYERSMLALWICASDGRLARLEFFDVAEEAQALARFDAVTGQSLSPHSVARHVRPNMASAIRDRTEAAREAEDADALAADLSDSFVYVHHPTGTSYGSGGYLGQWKAAFAAERFDRVNRLLGTLGDNLAISRAWTNLAGLKHRDFEDFGRTEHDIFVIVEAGNDGLCERVEVFNAERGTNALTRFYERYAELLPPGAQQARAATTARVIDEILGEQPDADRFVALVSPTVEFTDHRTLGFGSIRGPEGMRGYVNAYVQEEDAVCNCGDIVVLRPDIVLVRTVTVGTSRTSGGAYERPMLQLWTFADDGRLQRMEQFDSQDEARAQARFDELAGGVAAERSGQVLENAASCADRELFDRFNAHDWVGIEALAASDLVFDERRRLARNTCGREVWLEQFRIMFDIPESRFATTLVATRGDRLALNVHRFTGMVAGGGGPLDMGDHLCVHEVDDRGRIVAIVLFDLEDEAAAYAELDARYAAHRTADRFSNAATRLNENVIKAWRARDWAAIEALHAPQASEDDRRRLVGAGVTPGGMLATLRFLFETHDSSMSITPLATRGERLALSRALFQGKADSDGGDVAIDYLIVDEVDENGLSLHVVTLDADAIDAAYAELDARYEAGGADAHPQTWKCIKAFTDRVAKRDWDGVAALCADGFVEYDHRSLAVLGTTRGADAWVTNFKTLAELTTELIYRNHHFLPEARGYYVHGGWYGHQDGGDYELPLIAVVELDDRGLIVRTDIYDDAVDAAFARLAELAAPASELSRTPTLENAATRAADLNCAAWIDRDWERFEKRFPVNFHASDRRRGVLLELNREEMIAFSRSLGESATTRIIDVEPLDLRGERLALTRWRIVLAGDDTTGDDVGPSELVHLNLLEVDEDGLLVSILRWDDDDLDLARAELEARAAALGERPVGVGAPVSAAAQDSTGDPLARIKQHNAASRAFLRWHESYDIGADTGDWEPMRRLCSADHVFDDRRRMALVSGGRDLMIASARERVAMGARVEIELVGTAGDRILISRLLWSGGPPDGRFEIEYLAVAEINAAGLFTAFVLMNLDDPRAVQNEAWRRWAAIDPNVPGVVTPIGEALDAFNAQNAAAFSAAHMPDVVVHDHRLAGIGRIEGADAYTESVVALWELAPITQTSNGWFWPAFDACGGVTVLRRTGTLPEGGEFESEYLFLFLVDSERYTHIELFELHALDDALARFEELRSDPLRIPPNAATRVRSGMARQIPHGDWGALRSLVGPDFVYEDRSRHALVTGDVETWIGSVEFMMSRPGIRVRATALATVGDRILVDHLRWWGNPEGDAFELDRIRLIEVDGQGRVRANILFDSEDRDVAIAEAQARFLVGEAAGMPAQATITRMFRAWSDKDWDALRASIAEDIVIDDHRPLSFGRIGREEWIESWRVGAELAPDVAGNWVRLLDWNEHGRVPLMHIYGTRDGGEFENLFIGVVLANESVVTHFEWFAAEDGDRAVARFRELTSDAAGDATASSGFDPGGVTMNAAREATARWQDTFTACAASGDWEPLRAAYSEDAIFEDRQRHSLVSGDREIGFASARERAAAGSRPKITVLATLGERIVITRMLWTGGPPDGRFEVEHLTLGQADESGLLAATILFDVDDIEGVRREAWKRWAAIEPAVAPHLELLTTLMDLWNSQDATRFRAPLADDIVVEDHRLAGIGHIEGREAYGRANEVLWELAPDQRIEFGLSLHAHAPHGILVTIRRHGTLPDGGEFESVYLNLLVVKDGVITRLELFETDALDEAQARFEELRPDPLRVPPNDVDRALDRSRGITDVEVLRTLVSDDFVFDDRKKLSQSVGGVDDWVRSMVFLRDEARAEPVRELIATGGDRIALYRMLWSGGPSDGRFEIEHLFLGQLDEAGLFKAVLLFDPEDRAAAHAELTKRYFESGAAGAAPGAIAFWSGLNDHDLVRARSGLVDDFVLNDRRRTGMGVVDGADAYIASVSALYELSPDVRVYPLWTAAGAAHGRVEVLLRSGTNSEGGEFEGVFVSLSINRGDKLAAFDYFEPEDLDKALARFEELRPQSADSRESA